MRVDVLTLQRFYAAPLGETAQRMALRRLTALWPDADGLDFLGLGYPTPFLEPYRGTARRVVAAMPGEQGAHPWPSEGRGRAAMIDEGRLPLMDALFDRVLLVHALEEAAAPRPLLREIWRVLAPEGRLVVIVANRSGLWARAESTPFGHGRPFSRSQLDRLLREAMFEPTASARALFAPPLAWSPLVAMAETIERAGERVAPAFGGLLLMEAVKRVQARPPASTAERVVRMRTAAQPSSALAPKRGLHSYVRCDMKKARRP